MLFESELKLPTKTTLCTAHGLKKKIEFDAEPQHTLHLEDGDTIKILVSGRHDEVREIRITVSGSVTLIEDIKTEDSLLLRRSKNVANIDDRTLIGHSQI